MIDRVKTLSEIPLHFQGVSVSFSVIVVTIQEDTAPAALLEWIRNPEVGNFNIINPIRDQYQYPELYNDVKGLHEYDTSVTSLLTRTAFTTPVTPV